MPNFALIPDRRGFHLLWRYRHNSLNLLKVPLLGVASFGRIRHGPLTVRFARALPGGRRARLSFFASLSWRVWGHRHGV
jgi:hypothetical protein